MFACEGQNNGQMKIITMTIVTFRMKHTLAETKIEQDRQDVSRVLKLLGLGGILKMRKVSIELIISLSLRNYSSLIIQYHKIYSLNEDAHQDGQDQYICILL